MAPFLNFPDLKSEGVDIQYIVTVNKAKHPKGGVLIRLTEGCSPFGVKEGMGPL